MNREILFRGKRVDNGEWTQGYFFQIWERTFILWGTTNDIPNMIEVDPSTVGQYTGLTDKNGKQGFEADRLKYFDGIHTAYGVIRFGEIPRDFGTSAKHIGFYIEWNNDGMNEWNEWWRHDLGFWISQDTVEVCGTIYDEAET